MRSMHDGCRRWWGIGLGLLLASVAAAAEPPVLSTAGSGRATAYAEQNKIVTVGDKTHVVWLDADESGFWVRGRTLTRSTGAWSETVTIGSGQDNHGGPALTVDSEGYLHVFYYPHHEPIRYRRSLRPNDMTGWSEEVQFGEELSFPVAVCTDDDTLIVTARRGYHDGGVGNWREGAHMEQEIWAKPRGGDWQILSTILRSRYSGYAQYAAGLALGPDGRTLHFNARIYETTGRPSEQAAVTIAYLRSADGGRTWSKANGSPVSLPATAATVDVVIPDGGPDGPEPYGGSFAVDAVGTPHLMYATLQGTAGRLYLAMPSADSGWNTQDLTPHLPASCDGWQISMNMGAGVSISASGRITVMTTVMNATARELDERTWWGHRSTEVVRLWSDDAGKTWRSEVVSPVDPQRTHWLASIERATGHNDVPDTPGIFYTAGGAGGGLNDLDLNNEVVWCPAAAH